MRKLFLKKISLSVKIVRLLVIMRLRLSEMKDDHLLVSFGRLKRLKHIEIDIQRKINMASLVRRGKTTLTLWL